jgi:hypothetical protein
MRKGNLKSLNTHDLIARIEGIKVKPARLLLAFGAVLCIAYASMGATYLKADQTQKDLQTQIGAGSLMLAGLDPSQEPVDQLRDQLKSLQSELNRLQNSMPPSLDSATIVQTLLDDARSSGVIISQMSASAVAQIPAPKQGEPDYVSIAYTVVVQSDMSHIQSFLSTVENDPTQAVEIGNADAKNVNGQIQMNVTISFFAQPLPKTTPAPAGQPSKNG